jgi:hypothetical protein
MPGLLARLDHDTSEGARASGTFQVVSLEYENGDELTHLVDPGRRFRSIDELEKALAKLVGEPVTVEVADDQV